MKKSNYHLVSFLLLSLCFIFSTTALAGMARLSERADVGAFIEKMSTQHGFYAPNLVAIFNEAEIRPDIIKLMNRPKESSPWYKYRDFFIQQQRIDGGVAFWNQNAQALAEAQNKFGVPANIIVAIIGVETNYGKNVGKYRAFDALCTLAFNYPKRKDYFRHELEQFLLLTREQGTSPLAIPGSYAGAIGMPQFMPSSCRKYAVNTTNGEHPDLIKNPNDAINSVANYFKNHGWQANQPTVISVTVTGDKYKKYLAAKKINPKYTIAQLEKEGVQTNATLPKDTKASLIQLQGSKNNIYWLGFNNLYVITKYNGSVNYAMAVNELAQKIQAGKLAKKITTKKLASST